MSGATIPVVYFAYRRADLVARTLAALRANGVTLIYAFSDGARPGHEAEVEAVRVLLRAIDWADVRLVERPSNVGPDASIASGVSATLAQHDAIIVCEDDIEFAPGTVAYLTAALEHYRNEPRVMCIGAWTSPRLMPPGLNGAPHFSGRFNCWGWATWRRAWNGFTDLSPLELRERCAARGIDLTKYGIDVAQSLAGDVPRPSWDFQFSAYMMLQGGLTLEAPHALAAHIGYDGRASHTQDGSDWGVVQIAPAPPADQIAWPEVREHPEVAALWRRVIDPAPLTFAGRVRRRLSRLLGARPPRESNP